MKNYKKIIIIFITIIGIISISYTIYALNSNSSNDSSKEKTLSEIKYLENKFVNIFNSLNNIEYRNYKITTEDTKPQENKSSEDSSKTEENSENKEKSDKEESKDDENSKKYNLTAQGVLTNKEDINWSFIKNEFETIYESVPVITLDLYQLNLNKNYILNFNNDLDSLAKSINSENKVASLSGLVKVYSYIPKLLENTEADFKYKTIIKTKLNILEAYSVIDLEEWQIMTEKLKVAIDTYSELVRNTDYNNKEQYNINKDYIMLNELQNTINQKNKELFLIKYKNWLEDFNNL